jgi:hypothetical protein
MSNSPESLRAKADEFEQKAVESFERCDTDGFMSQWAHGINASLYRVRAEIAENDGKALRPVLVSEDGKLVRAKMVNAKFGSVWLLDDAAAEHYGRKFIPVGERSRVQARLGLSEEQRMVPAYAHLAGNNGPTSVYVRVAVDYEKMGWDF